MKVKCCMADTMYKNTVQIKTLKLNGVNDANNLLVFASLFVLYIISWKTWPAIHFVLNQLITNIKRRNLKKVLL